MVGQTQLGEVRYLDPRNIAGLGKRYVHHPGPYAISEAELGMIFPGMPDYTSIQHAGIGQETVEAGGTPVNQWTPINNSLKHNTNHINGDADPWNLILLNRIVAHLKPKTIVEVGTFRGKTAYNLALNAPADARVITIDQPKEGLTGHETYYGTDVMYRQLQEKIGAFLREEGRNPDVVKKIRTVFTDSVSLDAHRGLDEILQGEPIDFAFIDAGHDRLSVERNYRELIMPRMRRGGVVMLDNYGLANTFTHVGVSAFVQKIAEDGNVFYFYAPNDAADRHKATSCLIQPWIPECWAHRWEREVPAK